jgi:peptidoglycan hydrolase-like protein with peptidoglycan-binding domain
MRPRLGRALTAIGWLASLTLVGFVAYWAGRTAIAPPELPAEEHSSTTYVVAEGTVGRTVRVGVTASWPVERTIGASGDGVVTTIAHEAGDLLEAGDAPLTINLEPVVVASGSVPMFRTLKKGVEGPDVAQLQALLRGLGFLASPADGRFGETTEAAVKRWQKVIGAPADGVVEPGEVLFVDGLPVRAEVVPAVADRVTVGSPLLRIFAARPVFRALVSASLRAELASGMAIDIAGPGGTRWRGTLGAFVPRDDGRFEVEITGDVCGDACGVIALAGETALDGAIVLVPETRGPVVPTAALVQEPSGSLAVVLEDGTTRGVQVVVEANGFAVVKGLTPGTTIQLPSPSQP